MYLRGFNGGTYQGNYWSGVDQKDFANAFSEADSGWQVQNILYRYIGSRSSEGEGTVTVTRENPGGDYGYIPYGCAVPDDENVQADGCYASAGKEISYQGYVNWTEWMGSTAFERCGVRDRERLPGICGERISESSCGRTGSSAFVL